jgi:hypothetical protein
MAYLLECEEPAATPTVPAGTALAVT